MTSPEERRENVRKVGEVRDSLRDLANKALGLVTIAGALATEANSLAEKLDGVLPKPDPGEDARRDVEVSG